MGRRNGPFTFALSASLIAHGLLLILVAWWVAAHTPVPRLPALAKVDLAPAIIVPPPPPPAPPRPKPPLPDDFSKADENPLRDDSGETDGKGTANRSTPGERAMAAHAGLEQADLTRSRQLPSEVDKKTSNTDRVAQTGSQTPIDSAAPPSPPPAFGVAEATPLPAKAAAPPLIAVADPQLADVGSNIPAAEPLGSALGRVNAPATLVQPASVQKEIEGHPALSSDTDSTPFAKADSVTFADGKLDARMGQRVRMTHIDWGEAAVADAMAGAGTDVVLGVKVDAGGNVLNVVVLRSSGSANIDLPCQRTVYNWWFEPKKDKGGKPLGQLWVVNIIL